MRPYLYHHILQQTPAAYANKVALIHRDKELSYKELDEQCDLLIHQLAELECTPAAQSRVVIYLPKSPLLIISINAISRLNAIFVPIHPGLKTDQLEHILKDCQPQLLLTTSDRFKRLEPLFNQLKCPPNVIHTPSTTHVAELKRFSKAPLFTITAQQEHTATENDPAAILYTSGSSGPAKGVVLSHRNLIAGMESVIEYLHIKDSDNILAILPLSFDYGLSQITISLAAKATVILHDHLLTNDTLSQIQQHHITVLAGTPTLWLTLLEKDWTDFDLSKLRLLTNSGGKLSVNAIKDIQTRLPKTQLVLMYGLTEAFRSTYLPPHLLNKKIESMGIPIPNVTINVINESNEVCQAYEVGELIHTGPLVALGYWNRPKEQAERFTQTLLQKNSTLTQAAVKSGDHVYRDNDGIFYFVDRMDDQIKSAEYRVSPTELESVCMKHIPNCQIIAFGVPHALLGQAIVLVYSMIKKDNHDWTTKIKSICQNHLPNYMQPAHISKLDHLPATLNGKIDRQALQTQFAHLFPKLKP